MLASNIPLQFVIVAIFGTWMANNIKQVTVIYFVKYNLHLEPYFGLILLAVILQIMMGAALANLINDEGILECARNEASKILDKDPHLEQHFLLKEMLKTHLQQ